MFKRYRGIADIIVGAVFVVGAVFKAADVNLFAVQISFYGVIASPAGIDVAALGSLWVEMALGFALLLGARFRGLTYAFTLALLLVFTGLIAYGWAFHNLQDCGCFGKHLELSPGVSIGKNVVLALLCLVGWRSASSPFARWKFGLLGYGVPVLAACVTVAYAYAHLEAAPEQEGVFAQFVFEEEGIKYDLGKGEYFVPVLDMTCEHCMASVQQVNALASTPGFPPVVALCFEEAQGDLEDFRAQTAPEFPLHPLGSLRRLFAGLSGPTPPGFHIIRDGKSLKFWGENAPSAEDVARALQGNP